MANIKSQIKRIRTAERQRMRNKAVRSSLKTEIKKFQTSLDAGDPTAAKERLQAALSSVDKAASKGVIHKNNAANKKSSLTRSFNAMGSTSNSA